MTKVTTSDEMTLEMFDMKKDNISANNRNDIQNLLYLTT